MPNNLLQAQIYLAENPPAFKYEFISNILRGHQHTVFHIDESTKYQAETVINRLIISTEHSVTVLDYSRNFTIDNRLISRFINLIFLNDYKMLQIYLKPLNSVTVGNAIVVTSSKQFTPGARLLYQTPFIQRFGQILLVNILDSANHTFQVCFYCGLMSGVLSPVSSNLSANINLDDLFYNINDFYGQHFRISYINYFPYIYDWGSNPTYIGGSYVEVLKVLELKLNFTTSFEDTSHVHLYDQYINLLENGEFNFYISGITMIQNRMNRVPFLGPFNWEQLDLMYVHRKYIIDEVHLFFDVYNIQTWITLVFIIVLITLLIYIYEKKIRTVKSIQLIDTFMVFKYK